MPRAPTRVRELSLRFEGWAGGGPGVAGQVIQALASAAANKSDRSKGGTEEHMTDSA